MYCQMLKILNVLFIHFNAICPISLFFCIKIKTKINKIFKNNCRLKWNDEYFNIKYYKNIFMRTFWPNKDFLYN